MFVKTLYVCPECSPVDLIVAQSTLRKLLVDSSIGPIDCSYPHGLLRLVSVNRNYPSLSYYGSFSQNIYIYILLVSIASEDSPLSG